MARAKTVTKKPKIVDNQVITKFFSKCEEIVTDWNKRRRQEEKSGQLRVTLEKKESRTAELIVRIDPEPCTRRRGEARMTLLQIEYDPIEKCFMCHTPGMPFDNSEPVTLRRIRTTLDGFDI